MAAARERDPGQEDETPNRFRVGFVSSLDELQVDALPVQGSLPSWLSGSLVRTGPAQFEVGDARLRHWFDGLARLDAFSFVGGRVSYASRFLDSRSARAARETGKISFREFATDPCRSLFRRVWSLFSPGLTDNASVNVARIGRRFIAMTETPLPVEFDPRTLRTLGVFGYDDKLSGQLTTAHPHRDPGGNGLINYLLKLSRTSTYQVYRLPEGDPARREPIGTLAVKEPAYMHSFGMSENYVVLTEFPLVVNPLAIPLSGRPFIENYRWKPERGTRFLVMDRRDGRIAGAYEAAPFFAFHHVNAFEDGGDLVVDVAAYDDAAIIDALYLDALRSDSPSIPKAHFRRYRIVPGRSSVDYDQPAAPCIELPRINEARSHTRPYRFAYGVGTHGDRLDEFTDQLVKLDVERGDANVWREEGCYPGEPVFVSSPEAAGEDDGVVLAVVLDVPRALSFLVVLDAASFTELARAEVARPIPFYFHGQHYA